MTLLTVVKINSLPRSALADMTQIAIRESIPFIFLFIINYYFLFSSQVFNISLCNEKLFFLLIFIKMDKIIQSVGRGSFLLQSRRGPLFFSEFPHQREKWLDSNSRAPRESLLLRGAVYLFWSDVKGYPVMNRCTNNPMSHTDKQIFWLYENKMGGIIHKWVILVFNSTLLEIRVFRPIISYFNKNMKL